MSTLHFRQVIRARRRINCFSSHVSSPSYIAPAQNRRNRVTIMSTSSEKSLCTSEDKDAQERSSETTANENEETQKDERRDLPCDLAKKIYPSDFRIWPILSLLKPEFTTQIRMVMVYGSGGNRALIVTKDKDVYTLDHNKDDNLQTDATYIGLYPRKIEELCGKNIRTFACNSYLVLALTEEGEVYSWGFNKKRKTDDESHTPVFSATPTRVVGLSEKRIVDIACGSSHSLALTSDGMVYAWGENNWGQVGNENSSIFDGSLPRQVKHKLEGKKIEHIACGSMFNMVVTDKGKLYGWGNNKNGQISIDNATSSFTTSFTAPSFTASSFTTAPFTTAPFTTAPFTTSSFTAPSFTSSFSTSKSTSSPNPPPVYPSCLFGKTTSNNVELQKYYVYPHEITAVSGKVIIKVACGFEHTLALTDEGKIYAWGKNDNGQVGVNNKLKTSAPVMVNLPEMGKVLDIAAYGYLSVAIGSNETVYVWGDCFGQDINTPFPTEFSRIHDAFAYSKWRVMYKPLNVFMDDYEYVEEVLNILKSLGAGFDDPSTSDFTIQVEGQPIHVHKGILQIRCQHFKNKFQSDWSVDDQGVPVVYTVSNKFSYIVYKAFLKYLYTGKVDLPSENALELMKLADEYCETNLKRECGRIIEQAITASNVAFFYSKAIECNAKITNSSVILSRDCIASFSGPEKILEERVEIIRARRINCFQSRVTIMSTLSEKSLCTSEDKDAQKRSSETRAIEKEEGQNDKRRNVPFHLLKVIYSPDFRHWPILSLLNPEFTMQIRMVMVYGNWGSRTLIVTRDKNV